MQSAVILDGVSVTEMGRMGPIGQALYSGEVKFRVQLQVINGKPVVFDYSFPFSRVDNIDKIVDAGCKFLKNSLEHAATAAHNLVPTFPP